MTIGEILISLFIVSLLAIMGIGIYLQNKAINECENRGGIYIQSRSGGGNCFDKKALK